MNITFIVIYAVYIIFLIFFRSIFNINLKGYRRHIWLVLTVSAFTLTEQILYVIFSVESLPHFLYLSVPIQFFIAPTMFYLIKNKPRKTYGYKREDGLQLIPVLIGFIALYPIYSLDADQKLIFYHSPDHIINLFFYALIIQLLIYSILILTKLNVYKISKTDKRVLLITGLMLYFIVTIILGIRHEESSLMNIIAHSMLSITIIFYGLSNQRQKNVKQIINGNSVIEMIEKSMQRDQLYLQQDLNLGGLAKQLHLSPHKISEALNKQLSSNFNDYINSYRVNEVIRLLQDEVNSKFTLEALSKMAGFSSLTTFNATFKKQTGKTPKEYLL